MASRPEVVPSMDLALWWSMVWSLSTPAIRASEECLETYCSRWLREDSLSEGPAHFETSGNANTTSVEPPRHDWSGNRAFVRLPEIDCCHPVVVAMYCRPFTEYDTADPR